MWLEPSRYRSGKSSPDYRSFWINDRSDRGKSTALTDANAALFDVRNGFAGCIAGLHEILRRQGLLAGRWCLDPNEDLSPGQLEVIDRVCASYPQLTDDDFKRVGNIPYKPAEEAKVKAMLYRSITEFIAERYHSGQNFITRLNQDKNLESLKPGDTVRVPNVPPFQIESLREVGSLPMKPEFTKRLIKIDTRYRMLDIVDGDRLIGSYPITPGSQKLPAPIGTWKIVGIATMPWFRWDEAMLHHGERSENPGKHGLSPILDADYSSHGGVS